MAGRQDDLTRLLFGEQVYVQSSNVNWIGYDAVEEQLRIGFHNGGIYRYPNVTAVMAQQLVEASSKGVWVWDVLRGRTPPYTRWPFIVDVRGARKHERIAVAISQHVNKATQQLRQETQRPRAKKPGFFGRLFGWRREK